MGGTSSSPFGAASSAPGSKPPFGASAGKGMAPATPKASAKSQEKSSFFSRLPFFGGGAEKAAEKRQRPSKAPRVEGDGISLDTKLDILGVVLILGSLALFFSRLSSTQGQLFTSINTFLAQTFGWGSVGIPMAMIAVGLWLVARHFGEQAPVIPKMRLIGVLMLFVGLLVVLQFVESFNYVGDRRITNIQELRFQMQMSWRVYGAGGGWIGAQIYDILVTNIGEVGAFFTMFGWLLIGVMFALSLSVADMTLITISLGRSFNDSLVRRAQRRAVASAPSLEQLTASAAAAALPAGKAEAPMLPGVVQPQLPAPAEAALPAPAIPVPRPIAINVGGRSLNEKEPVPVVAAAAPGLAEKAPVPAAVGGFGSRLRGALPFGAKASAESANAKPAQDSGDKAAESGKVGVGTIAAAATLGTAAAAVSGVRGLFKRGKPEDEGGTATESVKPATPLVASAAPAAPVRPAGGSPVVGAPAVRSSAAFSPVKDEYEDEDEGEEAVVPSGRPTPPVRLADLIKDKSPFSRSEGSAEPARPAASGAPGVPADRPASTFGKPAEPARPAASGAPGATAADKPASAFGKPAEPARPAAFGASGATAADRPASAFGKPAEPARPAAFGASATAGEKPAAASAFGSPARPGSVSPTLPGQKPASPFATPAASPFKSASAKPLEDEDDDELDLGDENEDELILDATALMDDDLDTDDDEDEEMDTGKIASLPPATPRGTGILPRPEENRSRFGATTFGGSASASPAERLERVSAIPGGSLGAPAKPEADKPAEPIKPAATVTPAAASVAKPAEPPKPEQPDKQGAATPSNVQPASAFWKTGETTTATPAATAATPAMPAAVRPAAPVAATPAAAAASVPLTNAPPMMPAAPAPAPSSAFGRPTMPPGVAMPAQPPASDPRPEPTFNAARSPEIAIRPAGTGPVAPSAGMSSRKRKEWKLPNINTLLQQGSENDFDRESLLKRARTIEDTLNSFGAPGKVVEVNTGPVITQFGVEPDYLVTRGGKKNRVKVSAIAQLDKDIQLALGAKSIRIEAPVPGKGYVGIEVPNEHASLVSLRDVMEAEAFTRVKSPLAIALGQSVDGTPIAADLTSMPHLLIAGTTGSGKSVCVNAVITSIIAKNPPDRVKFIMVDPKRVELTGYNGIPHLVAPVVVDLERIVGVLKWVTREMDERYKRFSQAGARNIEDFNKHLSPDAEMMPYIVVIIDELADLMMLAPDETERVITRIAALARATGIHLVIATQRPSVDVVTGLIKANFPARIAFAVAGGVDSRVILDQPGAERLLGRGDMLYMSGDSPAPLRLQGVYVSDGEINNITRFWKGQMTEDDSAGRPISALVLDKTVAEPSRTVMPGSERARLQQAFWEDADDDEKDGTPATGIGHDNSDDPEDEMYEEAVEMVRRLSKASVSLLQRRLRIGYTRAARLIDRMEEEGIVGPAVEGAKPREVLSLRD
jgi:DNA segregation ATPase FtsK/SpoIIIE-like protein